MADQNKVYKSEGLRALSSQFRTNSTNSSRQAGAQNLAARKEFTAQAQQEQTYDGPYQNQELNKMYTETVQRLATTPDVSSYQALNPVKDAEDLVNVFRDTLQKSVILNKDSAKGKNPVDIARREYENALNVTMARYQTNGLDAQGMQDWLSRSGFQSQADVDRLNEQNMIATARKMQNQAAEDKYLEDEAGLSNWEQEVSFLEKTAPGILDAIANGNLDDQAGIERISQLTGITPVELPVRAGEAQSTIQRRLDQLLGAPGSGTAQGARDYLAKNGYNLSFLEAHPKDAQEYLDFYRDVPRIAQLVQEGREDELTDRELELWEADSALGNNLKRWDVPDPMAVVTKYAADTASGIQNALGLNNAAWQPTDAQRYVYSQYLDTLEGATAYAEESRGTAREKQAQDNLWFVKNREKYKALPGEISEYEKKSAYDENLSFGNEDLLLWYQAINGHNEGLMARLTNPLYAGASDMIRAQADDYRKYAENLQPEEKALFNALMAEGRTDEAQEYLRYLEYEVDARANIRFSEFADQLAGSGTWGQIGASALSVPLSLLRGWGYMDVLAQQARNGLGTEAEYRPVNYENAFAAGRGEDALRDAVMQNVNWGAQVLGQDVDLFDFLYGTTMSGADSLVAGLAGPVAGAMILGAGAAQSTMDDLYKNGATDQQILIGGTAAGIFESLFEEMSLGKFYDEANALTKPGFKAHLKNIGAQMGINFSEEFNTELANILFDNGYMGKDSKSSRQIQEYLRLGMTEEEAKQKVAEELTWQCLEAGLGGALMGAGFGALSNISSSANYRGHTRELGARFSAETKGSLWDIAKTLGVERAAKTSAETASNKQVGQVYRDVVKRLPENLRAPLQESVKRDTLREMKRMGGTADGEGAGSAVIALLEGRELTEAQTDALAGDELTLKVIQDLLGANETDAAAETEAQERPEEKQEAQEEEPWEAPPEGAEFAGNEETDADAGLRYDTPAGADLGMDAQRRAGEKARREQNPAILEGKLKTGETAAIQRVEMNEDTLRPQAVLEDGQTIYLDDMDLTQEEQILLNAAADMNEEAGRDLMRLSPDGGSVTDYARGYKQVYSSAAEGRGLNDLQTAQTAALSDAQRRAAWEAGRREWEQKNGGTGAGIQQLPEEKPFSFATRGGESLNVKQAAETAEGTVEITTEGGDALALDEADLADDDKTILREAAQMEDQEATAAMIRAWQDEQKARTRAAAGNRIQNRLAAEDAANRSAQQIDQEARRAEEQRKAKEAIDQAYEAAIRERERLAAEAEEKTRAAQEWQRQADEAERQAKAAADAAREAREAEEKAGREAKEQQSAIEKAAQDEARQEEQRKAREEIDRTYDAAMRERERLAAEAEQKAKAAQEEQRQADEAERQAKEAADAARQAKEEAEKKAAARKESKLADMDAEEKKARQREELLAEQAKAQQEADLLAQEALEATQRAEKARADAERKAKKLSSVEASKADEKAYAAMLEEQAKAQREADALAREALAATEKAEKAKAEAERKAQKILDLQAAENDAQTFARGFRRVYEAAASGRKLESIYGELLTDSQRQAAQAAGEAARERRENKIAALNEQAAKESGFRALRTETGNDAGLYFARVTARTKGPETDVQLRLIDLFARETGMQVRVYDTLGDANASYTQGTNIVNLGLDAQDGALTRAVSHEGYHFINQWSPGQGLKIKNFVLDALATRPEYDLEGRIREIQERYSRGGQELSRAKAEEEIVGNSLLDVIGTEENLKSLFKKDQTLAEKIGEWAKKTAGLLKGLVQRYAKHNRVTADALRVSEQMQGIADMYLQAAKNAGQNFLRAGLGMNETARSDADIREYEQDMKKATDNSDARANLEALLNKLYLRAEQGWIGSNAEQYENGFERFKNALRAYMAKENPVALSVALEQAGLDAQPAELNPQLTYAARQLADADERQITRLPEESFNLKDSYDYTKPFGEQVEDVIRNTHPQQEALFVGGTPKVMQDVGFTALPIGIAKGHAKEMLGMISRGNPNLNHLFGKDFVKDIPNLIQHPVAIIESRSLDQQKRENSAVMILSRENPNTGHQTVAAVEIERTLKMNGDEYDGYIINSVHGRENAMNLLGYALETEANDNHGVFFIDKKEAIKLSKSSKINVAYASRLRALAFDGFVHSITDEGGVVKQKPKKQTETLQFKRWFGNSVVTDNGKTLRSDGKPRIVYHGTGADFTAFDRGRQGQNYFESEGGFFFTSKRKTAENYAALHGGETGGNVMAVYLRMENPLTRRAPNGLTAADFYDMNSYDLMHDAELGEYDGIIIYGQNGDNLYVAFEPTQIKSATDNIGTFDPHIQDIRYNLKDDEYMQAVENGDVEAAQEMADEAAKAAGYTPVTRYHQTDKEFTEFKTDNPVAGANDSETPNGIFFKENDHDIGVGGDYVKTGHGGDIQMRVYLKADNMLHFKNRTEAAAWYKKNVPGYQKLRDEWEQLYNEKYKPQFDALEEEQFDPDTTPERYEELDAIEEKLIQKMGEEERANARKQRALLDEYFLHGNSPYDGIELDYDGHRYIDGKRENVHTFIVFDASQVKSADAITYDDAGNVIPLSQRFNTQSNDIRYNLKDDGGDIVRDVKDDADLYAQAMSDQEIRDSLESAGRLLAFIQQNSLRQKDTESWKKWARGYAKKVLTETGSKYSAQKLQKELNQVYEAIDKGGYNAGELMIRLRELGRRVLEAAPGVVVEMDETTKAARDALKTGAFYLTEDQKEAIQLRYGSLGAYMRKNFGKLAIRKRAQGAQKGARSSLADVWTESLSPLLPSVFAQDTIEADMPEIIDAFLETSGEKKYAGEFGRNIGQYATSLGLEMLRDYLNAPFIQDSIGKLREGMEARVGDAYQREQEARARAAALQESFRSKTEGIREHYQEKYEQRIQRDKERRENTEERQKAIKDIQGKVRRINTMTVNPTNQRHVPEELRGAAISAIRPFLSNTSVFSRADLDRLSSEYAALMERKGEMTGLDADILDDIRGMAETMDGKRLSQLTNAELSSVQDVIGNLYKVITEQNEAKVNGMETTIDLLSGQMKEDMRKMGDAKTGPIRDKIRWLMLREMTPIYFADNAGPTLKAMIKDFYAGMETWMNIAEKAKEAESALVDKYKVNEWINDKNTLRFISQRGERLELNRREALSLYALWKRETTNKIQNAKHLQIGGFTYEKGARYQGVDTLRPHTIAQSDMDQVRSFLGKNQMAFADEMVKYLTETLGEEGNKTSMELYGFKKFKEGYYFPYETDRHYLVGELTQTGERTRQPKDQGMSKATLKNAATPIMLHDFFQVWGNHVNNMGLYAGFAQSVDLMNRVLNDRISAEVTMDPATNLLKVLPAESNWAAMARAMGDEGVQYLKTLVKDVAGGVRADERGFAAKGLSMFKKSAVAANLSVALQQPTAYARAMLMVNPRYMLVTPADLAKLPQRIRTMYEYSGVAKIKRMGKFDTGTGKSAVAWITEPVNDPSKMKWALEKIDDVTGIGAEKADEWTWGILWGAIEKETQNTRAELKPGTKEFYQAVKERFEDVVNHTQVYDSVLSRSEWMRSNTTFDKMATSFMAEPTLSLNMLMDSFRKIKSPGGKKIAARAAGVFLVNALLTALAKGIMTATRKKDEEGKTWTEKYLAAAAGEFMEDISPFGLAGMIPWARDVVSLLEGYDVERSDMDAVEMLVNAYKTLTNENKSAEDKIQAISGAVGNVFGIPLKNIWRDGEAILRNMFGGASAAEPTSPGSLKYSVLDEMRMGPISLWDSSRNAYYTRMADALARGDMDNYNELYQYVNSAEGVKDETVISGIKKAIQNQVEAGRMATETAAQLLEERLGVKAGEGYFTVKKWMDGENKYDDFIDAVKTGTDLKSTIKAYTDNGVETSTLAGQITSYFKPLYIEAAKRSKVEAANLKARILTAYEALGYDRNKKIKDIDAWLKQ